MSIKPSYAMKLLTKQGVVLGLIEPTEADDLWSHGRFYPSPDFDLVESLFYKRKELIDEQLLMHEGMLYEAIMALGLTMNGIKLDDFQLDDDNECGWKYAEPQTVSAELHAEAAALH
jgi:hypothetical protein